MTSKIAMLLLLVAILIHTEIVICQDENNSQNKCRAGKINGVEVDVSSTSMLLHFDQDSEKMVIHDISYAPLFAMSTRYDKMFHMNCIQECSIFNLKPRTEYCLCVAEVNKQCALFTTTDVLMASYLPLRLLFETKTNTKTAHFFYSKKTTVTIPAPKVHCQYLTEAEVSAGSCRELIKKELEVLSCIADVDPNNMSATFRSDGSFGRAEILGVCAQHENSSMICECINLRESEITREKIDFAFNITDAFLEISCNGDQCNNTYQLDLQCTTKSFCWKENPCNERYLQDIEFPLLLDLGKYQGTIVDAYIIGQTLTGAKEIVAEELSIEIALEETIPKIEATATSDSVFLTWHRGTLPWAATSFTIEILRTDGGKVVEKHVQDKVVGCDFSSAHQNLSPYTNYSWIMYSEIPGQATQKANGSFTTEAASCLPPQDVGVVDENPQRLVWKPNPKNIGTIECYLITIAQNKINEDCLTCEHDECSYNLPSSLPNDIEISGTVSCRNQGSSEWGKVAKWENRTIAMVPSVEDVKLTPLNCRAQCSQSVRIHIENLRSVRYYGQIKSMIVYYNVWSQDEIDDMTSNYSSISIDDISKEFVLEELRSNTLYQVILEVYTKVGSARTSSVIFKTSQKSGSLEISAHIFTIIFMGIILICVFVVAPKHIRLIRVVPHLDLKKTLSKGPVISHPIRKNDIINSLKALLDQKNTLQSQFDSLRSAQPDFAITESEASNYTSKNRYGNIVPYDNCRVTLKEIPGDINSEYINASYLDSYHQEMQFIATQGPMKNTVGDFWRMVWQKDVKVIVMLGAFIEKGRDMCWRYWPEENQPNGIILPKEKLQIVGLDSNTQNHWIEQKILVQKNGKEKSITHAWYNEWLDMGCPNSLQQILLFLHYVKDVMTKSGKENHVIVHCSAGVGRTGTFIELFNLMDELADNKSESINIALDLHIMRYLRMSMVQTVEQYILIHQVILLHCAETLKNKGDLNNDEYEAILSLITVKSKFWAQGRDVLSDVATAENSLIPFSPEELKEEESNEGNIS